MAISEKRRLTFTAIAVAVTGVVTGLILGVALFSGGDAPSAADSTPTSSSTDGAGGELFANNCSACHGKNREGITNLGPALIQQSLAELSDDEIREVISIGRVAKGMPPWQGVLSATEIDDLLQFIRSAAP